MGGLAAAKSRCIQGELVAKGQALPSLKCVEQQEQSCGVQNLLDDHLLQR